MKTKTILILLTLLATYSFGQEIKKELLIGENFKGDTFHQAFSFPFGTYTRTAPEFDGLKMSSSTTLRMDVDTLNQYLSRNGGLYDSLYIEVSYAHRFPNAQNSVELRTNWVHYPFAFIDNDTHVVSMMYLGQHQEIYADFAALATGVYVNYLNIYGYRFDTSHVDTPNTGINEALSESVNVFAYCNEILLSNEANQALSIIVRDMAGRDITTFSTSARNRAVPIEQQGIYVILIRDEKGNALVKKVAIQ